MKVCIRGLKKYKYSKNLIGDFSKYEKQLYQTTGTQSK